MYVGSCSISLHPPLEIAPAGIFKMALSMDKDCHDRNAKKAKHDGAETTTPKASSSCQNQENTDDDLTYVEFYAGVGGWTMALAEAISRVNSSDQGKTQKRLRRVAAMDHSDLCMKCFRHNFGEEELSAKRQHKAFNIERLTLKQVEEWGARIWMMSPPCQPHTRQHENQSEDLDDPRSASFLHICRLLTQMKPHTRPSLLFLENVIGFESSKSCDRWLDTLVPSGYAFGHFHLTPTQVGLPNDRPRYFCLAVRSDRLNQQSPLMKYISVNQVENISLKTTPAPYSDIQDLGVLPEEKITLETLTQIHSLLDNEDDEHNNLKIPRKILDSSKAWCFDIVKPGDRRSACFTSAYGKFVRGTGSVLYNDDDDDNTPTLTLQRPDERQFTKDWAEGLDLSKLRYFSGSEIARLMGFQSDFSFPADVTAKQQWKLLGNSLNVQVAAKVVELGLRLHE